jgi:pimeloyl-ACP methyl ester carboxylesterase
MTTSPTPRAIEVNGLTLRVWDHGGAGPAVLFTHGFLDTGRSFDAIAAALGDDARVLALDFRGHGDSDRIGPGGSYHLLDHVKDLSLALGEVERELLGGDELAALVGHSMGGNVSLLVAGTLPERVSRLLLLDALGPPSEDAEDQPERLANALRALGHHRPFSSFATVDDALDRLQRYNPGLTREGARRMAEPVLRADEGDPGRLRFPFDARLRGPTPVRWGEAMWRALCARVTAEVSMLRAAGGYVPEGEPASGRLAAMKRVTWRTVEGVSHHLHVDAPDVVADELRALIGRSTDGTS